VGQAIFTDVRFLPVDLGDVGREQAFVVCFDQRGAGFRVRPARGADPTSSSAHPAKRHQPFQPLAQQFGCGIEQRIHRGLAQRIEIANRPSVNMLLDRRCIARRC
jgi:hypothetical protein